jgi:hypothetical protein
MFIRALIMVVLARQVFLRTKLHQIQVDLLFRTTTNVGNDLANPACG